MSNKFNKLLIMVIFVLIIINLYGFEPKVTDFVNSYQYKLYRSWLETEKLDGDLPAGFTSEKVVRSFRDKNGREISVEYDWQNWKISSQREIIPFTFYIDNYPISYIHNNIRNSPNVGNANFFINFCFFPNVIILGCYMECRFM